MVGSLRFDTVWWELQNKITEEDSRPRYESSRRNKEWETIQSMCHGSQGRAKKEGKGEAVSTATENGGRRMQKE